MAAPNGRLSSDLPFGAENSTLNRWRAAQTHSQSRQHDHLPEPGPAAPSTPQYFEDFIAAEIARDKERGVATSPIAPSSISDLSAVQKRWLRRHRKQWWLCLVTLQLAFGSTVAAIVITIQNARGSGLVPGQLIWMLLSIALGVVSIAVLLVLYVRRRDRRSKEKTWAKLEIEKYKRDMEKSQREADRASTIGKRLGREYRSASRAASVRSRSVHSERGSGIADPTEGGEVGRTFLNYQEIYRNPDLARDIANVGPSAHAQPSRSRQDLPPLDNNGTLRAEFAGPTPPVPPKDTMSTRGTATRSNPTHRERTDTRQTNLDRFVRDELHLRADQDNAWDERDVVRAGHGERGSVQSDDNFREMHQLESDAVSDDSYMAERRRGRSREQVEPWRRQQLSHEDLEDPQTPSRLPRNKKSSRSRDGSIGTKVRNGPSKQTDMQESVNSKARQGKQGLGTGPSRLRGQMPVGPADERPLSLQGRSIRSTSAPARSSKGKEEMRDG